ncbi:MAG: hypothetical protein HY684_02615 [Chloroflexi bacterium]|nr:hypothetical protein [Chloroflexota bacterium]
MLGLRGWLVAVAGTTAALLLIGVPTAIIDNPFFIRMTPIRIQDYILWVATAMLIGLIAGTFAPAMRIGGGEGKAASGGLLSTLAVGCPICNKLVVLLLGTSGALTFFAPAQLYLGIASLLLLGWTLRLRARVLKGICPVSAPDRLKEIRHEGG